MHKISKISRPISLSLNFLHFDFADFPELCTRSGQTVPSNPHLYPFEQANKYSWCQLGNIGMIFMELSVMQLFYSLVGVAHRQIRWGLGDCPPPWDKKKVFIPKENMVVMRAWLFAKIAKISGKIASALSSHIPMV